MRKHAIRVAAPVAAAVAVAISASPQIRADEPGRPDASPPPADPGDRDSLPDEAVKLAASFDRKCESVLEPVTSDFLARLERLEARLATAGDLEPAVAVRRYREEATEIGSAEEIFGLEPPGSIPEIRSEIEAFAGRCETAVRPWRTVYIAELHKLERRLADAGRLEDALAVQREREIATALADQGALARVEGRIGKRPKGDVALARAGAKAVADTDAKFLIDGDTRNFDRNTGYAVCAIPGSMSVELDGLYVLSRIRFLLWDLEQRGYKYRLQVSKDAVDWTLLHDQSEKFGYSWQEIEFEPTPIRFIKIEAIDSTVEFRKLPVVELEAK